MSQVGKYTPFKGKDTKKKYKGIQKLKKMDYDPIKELVWLARELADQNQYWKDIRDGKLVELTEKGGNKRYSAVAHVGVLGLMGKVATDLLPYAYSKVPEDTNLNVSGGGQFNIYAGEVNKENIGILEHEKEIVDVDVQPVMPSKG